MRIRGAAVTLSAALAMVPVGAYAQEPDPVEIDALFAEYDNAESPGCALGVVQDGRIVYQRGYGNANLDYGIPNGPDMVYYVGSVSKQFTAAAIALLAEEGGISLDDDVRRYIPELPDYGRVMTIRHLVHHTSGLRDVYTLMSLAGIRMEDVFTDDDALALITRQRRLNFLPGDDYLYSNTGYWLLGRIVQRVTGSSLRVYADRKIFAPLGMRDTHFHDDPSHVMRNRVVSYGGDAESGYRITYLFNFDKIGAGGLYTTLGDLARWDANFHDPVVGGPEFLRTMHTRAVLTSGDTLSYAFGQTVQRRRGLDMVRHSGSLMGFRADLVRYPAARFSVVTLCNLASIDAAELADGVTDLYLRDRLEPPAAVQAQAATRTVATPAARPDPAAGGGTDGSPASFAGLDGHYYSVELNATWQVVVHDGAVHVTLPASGTQVMRPVGVDRFGSGSQIVVRFQRDPAGHVVGLSVDAGRVRDIGFERQP